MDLIPKNNWLLYKKMLKQLLEKRSQVVSDLVGSIFIIGHCRTDSKKHICKLTSTESPSEATGAVEPCGFDELNFKNRLGHLIVVS
jgi:hypothetical protein